MRDLRSTSESSENTGSNGSLQQNLSFSSLRRVLRALRSATAITVYFAYLFFLMGPVQRLIVAPLVWLMPARRTRMLASWVRFNARVTRAVVCGGGGVQIDVQGVKVRESSIVLMNHQSVLDVPILLCEVEGPAVLIPVRIRYRYGVPGISPFLRLAGYPFVSQERAKLAIDLATIDAAAARVAAGEATIAFFPEGHRTRDGEIGRFMVGGLSRTLAAAKKPVYCIVGDGMWRARTLADSLVSLAGTKVAVRITGPFAPPERAEDIPPFIASLRDHMVASLQALRSEGTPGTPRQADSVD